ncbi:hypothetical protein Dimus_026870 [Dionaea muscipula]
MHSLAGGVGLRCSEGNASDGRHRLVVGMLLASGRRWRRGQSSRHQFREGDRERVETKESQQIYAQTTTDKPLYIGFAFSNLDPPGCQIETGRILNSFAYE